MGKKKSKVGETNFGDDPHFVSCVILGIFVIINKS